MALFPKKQARTPIIAEDYGSEHPSYYANLWGNAKLPWNFSLRTRRPSLLNFIRLISLLAALVCLEQYFNITSSFSYLFFVPDRHFELFKLSVYRDLAAGRLSGAVKIPTITYDDMGVLGEDQRWDIFYAMADYLETVFPRLHDSLNVTTVNEHGLLYIWYGSDGSLKPLCLMTHQDVVPVPDSTVEKWTYPPFSGHYDGTYIWGRGAEDDKSNLIAKLSVVEALLQEDFTPKRTIIIAVGFDEEGGNESHPYGAKGLSEEIERIFGHNSIEVILDEGSAAIEEHFGSDFAMLGTAEKGYIDIQILVQAPGGHSSAPLDHTAIDYLAKIITAIDDHHFPTQLTNQNPTMKYLSLAAKYGKTIPEELRKAILDPQRTGDVLEYLASSSPETKALIGTSSAVDVIRGGEKANQLPETAQVIINHRIAVESSVKAVETHYIGILQPLSKAWNFSLYAFGEEISYVSPYYIIKLTGISQLEPSPVTDIESKTFIKLTDTIHNVFSDKVTVSPFLEIGNTDTKFYWNLSDQIYRFNPWRRELDPAGSHIHTVDERMPVEGLLQMIEFYYHFIRMMDREN